MKRSKMQLRLKFYNFLTDNDAYKAFVTNLKDKTNSFAITAGCTYTISRWCANVSPEHWMSAFSWTGSPEGLDYWMNLSVKWKRLLNEEEKL